MSGYQHLTLAGEGSTHILTYNPVSGYTHIWYIWSILKKTLILSHISQSKIYTKCSNLLDVNNLFSNIETYQRSQYWTEYKSEDAWLSWGTNRDWGVYMNKLQFLSKSEN